MKKFLLLIILIVSFQVQLNADENIMPPGVKNSREALDLDSTYLYCKGLDWENVYKCKLYYNESDGVYTEPAFWYIFHRFGVWTWNPNLFDIFDELNKKNPALSHFMYGMCSYLERSTDRFRCTYDRKSIKKHMLKAIFLAAYGGITKNINECEDLADKYLQADTADFERTEMLDDALTKIKQMKMDKGSKDPMNGYNRALVASWSAAVLWSVEKNSEILKDSYKDFTLELEKIDKGFEVLARGSKGEKVSKWDITDKHNPKGTFKEVRYMWDCYREAKCNKHFK